MAGTRTAPAAGRAVIVGNSDGIGLALTRRLLDTGWTVAGLSRRPSPVRHQRYVHDVADVTTADYPAVLARRIEALGGVELCVYAAGIGALLDAADPRSQTRTLDVNLMGAARTLDLVVPPMVAARTGHVVGLSSLADVTVSDAAPGYAASKAGLTSYLLGLALALRPHGIAVTTVRFGFVDTKMAKSPSTPMMISVERAVDVLMAALRDRPAVISYPRRMAMAARLLGGAAAVRARTQRWRAS